MATKKNGNLSGKLGNEIHSSWNGRPYTRRRPESVANPRTEAQQGHRNAFAEISRLSSKMKAAHLIGLHWKAMREKLNTHCVFKKINKDLYNENGIDYPGIAVSYGSVPSAEITSAQMDGNGVLKVTFDSYGTSKDAADTFHLFVYCPELQEGGLAPYVRRSDGVITAVIPETWRANTLHCYAFLRNKKGQTSDTIYFQPR